MTARDYNPDELKGVLSAPVPGFPCVRADEYGTVWKWNGSNPSPRWERVGIGRDRKCSALKTEAGKKVRLPMHRLVCMAWHGTRPKGWCVRPLDGDYTNTKPQNLEWVEKRPGRPRKLSRWKEGDIRERAEEGETFDRLAKRHKVTEATISRICKDVPGGVSVSQNRKLTPDERAELVRQRKAGTKLVVLVRRFKRSATQIQRIMKQERERERCTQWESTSPHSTTSRP